jgi:protein-disulfide isomerase
MANQPKLTRDQQREAARAKARELREKHQATEKRNKVIIQVSVVAGILAIIGVIVLALSTSPSTQGGLTPSKVATYNTGGIKIGTGLKAFSSTSTPTPSATPGAAAVPNIRIYIDYQCPFCQGFEAANGPQIADWVSKGTATVEVHPISFLDPNSTNHYSSRAANAAYCVAENSPDTFFAYNQFLFANQPAEGSAGPDNATLYKDAVDQGATNLATVKKCIDGDSYGKWIGDNTTSLIAGGKSIPGTKFKLTGTPFIIVNDRQYTYANATEQNDPARFAQFVQQVSAQ